MKRKRNPLYFLVAVLALCEGNVQSQINMYPVDQIITMNSGSFTIDVDNDGNEDYTFEILPLSDGVNAARVISLGSAQVMDGSTFGYPDALNLGDSVTGPYSSGNAVLGTDVGGGGEFPGAGMKYLGLHINRFGENHLGWISLEVVASNDTIILHDVAYNTTANDGITAGLTNLASVDAVRLIDVEIYPNPCHNFIELNWSGADHNAYYSMHDATGTLIMKGACSKKIEVFILASGTYILTISDGTNVGRTMFTKN